MKTCLVSFEHHRLVGTVKMVSELRGGWPFLRDEFCPLDVFFWHPLPSEVVPK
jgi:hypothetical protein